MTRECELSGIPTREEAEKVKSKFESWDGCTNVEITGDGPFTVSGECAAESTKKTCAMSGIPTREAAENVKQGYENWDGCTDVEITGDGPFTVTGKCE